MKSTFIPTLCICLFLTFSTKAQSLKKNQIGVELGGNNIYYSVYYQHNISVKKHYIGLKLGITPYFPTYDIANSAVLSTTLGKNNRWFVGMGYTLIDFDESHPSNISFPNNDDTLFQLLMPELGYQVLTKNQQNFWRFSMIVPIQVGNKGNTDLAVPVWGSISFGWIFN